MDFPATADLQGERGLTDEHPELRRRRDDRRIDEILQGQDEIKRLILSITKAFPTNDLGEPDYEGHRLAHKKAIDKEQKLEAERTNALRHVRNASLVGGGGIMLTALWEYIKMKVLT
jgi:hypothetical protein